jgi:hypothetical protein
MLVFGNLSHGTELGFHASCSDWRECCRIAGGASLIGFRRKRHPIIVDRDVPPDSPVARKGVPQGRHVHGVLAGGYDVLKSFFPGIVDELTAEGARISDVAQDVLWFSKGAWRLRCKSGIVGCVQSRPFLEMHIRRRIVKLPNVQQLCNVSVAGFEMDAPNSRITGLHVSANSSPEKTLPADLVIDCSGRGAGPRLGLKQRGLESRARRP